MSDNPPDRTPEEQEANAAKLNAEAALALAEARKAAAEAAKAEHDAVKARIAADTEARKEQSMLAADEYHHVYRFTGGVEPGSVQTAVKTLTEWHRLDPECDIEVIFFSPGGSVTDGFVLFDHLRWLSSQGHHITTGCTGMAASMGGILLQAGDHRWMDAESWVMIHRAAFGAVGKSWEIEDRVDWVKRIEKRIVDIFVSRSDGKLTAARIKRNWDRRDWWNSSDECLSLGIVDSVR